ncbi:MAG: recombination protein RecO [Campylobacterales bacterium]|nr:recombination protein RecO [Campylobacterales bacterium]
MQGYIVHITKAKEEDLIVHILTETKLKTAYRFYGARHSVIHAGYKIDFEPHYSTKSSLPQLREVLHLGHRWNASRERMLLWQRFIALFYPHLKDIESLETFYLELLDWCAVRWEKQNPKRIALEAYVKLLAHEGRLHEDFRCFVCDLPLGEKVVLSRGFLLAHPACVYQEGMPRPRVEHLLSEGSALHLDDAHVELLWRTLLEGL